jgi:uncharacterized protein YxeA
MKKFVILILVLVIGIVFAMTGFAQDKKPAEATAPAVKTEAPATPEKQAAQKKVTKKKHHKKKKTAKPAASKEKPAETAPAK